MTPEVQRIAIAEACGAKWFPLPSHRGSPDYFRVLSFAEPRFLAAGARLIDSQGGAVRWFDHGLPNYPNDLNAMHQAEKVLTIEQKEDYVSRLMAITIPGAGYGVTSQARVCHSTATQRAEAFLRTLNLWKEEQ